MLIFMSPSRPIPHPTTHAGFGFPDAFATVFLVPASQFVFGWRGIGLLIPFLFFELSWGEIAVGCGDAAIGLGSGGFWFGIGKEGCGGFFFELCAFILHQFVSPIPFGFTLGPFSNG